jgi:hypothetical protein
LIGFISLYAKWLFGSLNINKEKFKPVGNFKVA